MAEVATASTTIVKVQLPIGGTEQRFALVYGENRTHERFIPVDVDLRQRMAGRAKAFFHARLLEGGIELLDEAEWQSW